MATELSDADKHVITVALAHRAGQCDERIDRVAARPLPDEAEQIKTLSYWIGEHLVTQRTLVHAREVFWS